MGVDHIVKSLKMELNIKRYRDDKVVSTQSINITVLINNIERR
jgi:hypothetical protein